MQARRVFLTEAGQKAIAAEHLADQRITLAGNTYRRPLRALIQFVKIVFAPTPAGAQFAHHSGTPAVLLGAAQLRHRESGFVIKCASCQLNAHIAAFALQLCGQPGQHQQVGIVTFDIHHALMHLIFQVPAQRADTRILAGIVAGQQQFKQRFIRVTQSLIQLP